MWLFIKFQISIHSWIFISFICTTAPSVLLLKLDSRLTFWVGLLIHSDLVVHRSKFKKYLLLLIINSCFPTQLFLPSDPNHFSKCVLKSDPFSFFMRNRSRFQGLTLTSECTKLFVEILPFWKLQNPYRNFTECGLIS